MAARAIDVADVSRRCGRGRRARCRRRRHAVNLCEDRYAFLVAFCAVAWRGQTQPAAVVARAAGDRRSPAAHPGSYALGDERDRRVPPRHFVRMPALGEARRSAGDARARGRSRRRDRLHLRQHRPAESRTQRPGPASAPARARTRRRWRSSRACPRRLAHIVATVPPQHMYGLELSVLLPLLGRVRGARRAAVLPGRRRRGTRRPAGAARAGDDAGAPARAAARSGAQLPPLAAITCGHRAARHASSRAEAEARYGAPVIELFGSTETCVIAHRRTRAAKPWRLYPGVDVAAATGRHAGRGAVLRQPPTPAAGSSSNCCPAQRFAPARPQQPTCSTSPASAPRSPTSTAACWRSPASTTASCSSSTPTTRSGVRRIAALVVAPTRSEARPARRTAAGDRPGLPAASAAPRGRAAAQRDRQTAARGAAGRAAQRGLRTDPPQGVLVRKSVAAVSRRSLQKARFPDRSDRTGKSRKIKCPEGQGEPSGRGKPIWGGIGLLGLCSGR